MSPPLFPPSLPPPHVPSSSVLLWQSFVRGRRPGLAVTSDLRFPVLQEVSNLSRQTLELLLELLLHVALQLERERREDGVNTGGGMSAAPVRLPGGVTSCQCSDVWGWAVWVWSLKQQQQIRAAFLLCNGIKAWTIRSSRRFRARNKTSEAGNDGKLDSGLLPLASGLESPAGARCVAPPADRDAWSESPPAGDRRGGWKTIRTTTDRILPFENKVKMSRINVKFQDCSWTFKNISNTNVCKYDL